LKPKRARDQEHEEGRRPEEQHRLHDLDPGRGQHPAERDIDHHADADHDDRDLVGHAEEELDQSAAASQLRHEVGEVHDDRADHRGEPRLRPLHAEGEDVAQRVPARVAERLGHEEQDGEERHERPDRVQRSVHAVERREAAEAEKGCGAHPVARERKAVLHGGELTVGRVEVARRAGPARGPVGDPEREAEDGDEDEEAERSHAPLLSSRARSARGSNSRAAMRM